MEQNFMEDESISLSKKTLDTLFEQKNPTELVALYVCCMYAKKWGEFQQSENPII